jgi:hypothetical protein
MKLLPYLLCCALLAGAGEAHALARIRRWFPGRCEARVKHGAKVTVAVTNGWVIINGATTRTHIQFTTLRNVNLLINTADKLSFKRSPKQRNGVVSNLWFGTSASLMRLTNDIVYTGSDTLQLLLDHVDVRSVRARAMRRVELGVLRDELGGGCLRGLQLWVRDVLGGPSAGTRLRIGLPGFFTPVATVYSGARIEWLDARQLILPPLQRNPRTVWRARYYPMGDILVRVEQSGMHKTKNVLLTYTTAN